MQTFKHFAEIPGVSYVRSSTVDRKALSANSAREYGLDGSIRPSRLLRRLEEALELPGEPIDYHFLIQDACGLLYWRRRQHPGSLEHVERLARLDVELVEAYPEMIEYEPGQYYRVETFFRLVRLYEREGQLREALEFAKRGVRCHQDLASKVEELQARLAVLEAEDTE